MGGMGGGMGGGPGGPAGPGGAPDMMSGMPGAGGMGGPMPGGDMGQGIPMSPGSHMSPAGGGAAAASGGGTGFIGRKSDKSNKKADNQQMPMPTVIQLTKPEQKLYKLLNNMSVPFKIFAQFKQQVPGNNQPFVMDFAYPDLKIDIEADGEKWHSKAEDKVNDNRRDLKLAGMGWTVLRFTDSAINEDIAQIEQIITKEISDVIKHKNKMSKKASVDQNLNYKVTSQGWDIRMSEEWSDIPIIVKSEIDEINET